MKILFGKLLFSIQNIINSLIGSYQRSLFSKNEKSIIDNSFKTGNDNFFDIHSQAEIVISNSVTINHSNFITIKKNAKLSVGKNTYITRATISCLGEINIGENCILGEGMKIFDHNHQYTRHPFSVSKTDFSIGKVNIGNNVWTGANVIILKDVSIGNNVIIGAGCVIHKDVPDNAIIINKQEQIIKDIK